MSMKQLNICFYNRLALKSELDYSQMESKEPVRRFYINIQSISFRRFEYYTLCQNNESFYETELIPIGFKFNYASRHCVLISPNGFVLLAITSDWMKPDRWYKCFIYQNITFIICPVKYRTRILHWPLLHFDSPRGTRRCQITSLVLVEVTTHCDQTCFFITGWWWQ